MKSSSDQQLISRPPQIQRPGTQQPGTQQLQHQIQQAQQLQQIQEQQIRKGIEQQQTIIALTKEIKKQQIELEFLKNTIKEQQRPNKDYIEMVKEYGVTKVIEFFIKIKEPTDQSDSFGMTLLHCAVNYNNLQSVKFLLGEHVNSRDKEGSMYVNSRDKEGLTALHYGAHRGNIEAVKELLKAKEINPNLGDRNGMTPLHHAAKDDNIEAVKALLEAEEVNPNLDDKNGMTPLHHAAKDGKIKAVSALLKAKKVNPNPADKNGLTPLHYAAHRGNIEAVKALLQVAEVNPNVPDKDGNTPLQYAAHRGKIEAVKALLQAERVNPNEGDKYGINPLHYAAKHGNIEAVNALLKAERVNPDAHDNQGMTPLHYASYNARFEVVEALNASYKAKGKEIDVNKTGNGEEGSLSGKKPMELATLSTSSDYEKIRTMALLYKYGGKIEGEKFFINLDGNEWVSKDLNENIRKLNAQDQKSFSVNDFMIDVEAREKLKKDIAQDDAVHDALSIKKGGRPPSDKVYPLDGERVKGKRARIGEGSQSERVP